MTRRFLAPGLSVLLSGCAAALAPVQAPYDAVTSPRQVFRIYAGAQVAELHGLRWTPDSVSGVPYFRPLSCHTCRIAVGRTVVDSVKQVQGREALGMLAAALPLAVLAALAASFSSMGD